MGEWQKVKVGDFLKPYRIEHIVENDKTYRQVTISKNYGISFRGEKLGKNIGRKRQFIIDLKTYPHSVLFTRQGIRDGAIGVAPPEIDACIVTENMPVMSVNTDLIEMAYLKKLLISNYFCEKIQLLTVVGSAQKSIHERDVLNIEIDIPNIKVQQKKGKKFNTLDVEQEQLKQELTYQQTLLKKLRQQILQEAIEGNLTADWRKQNPDIEPASKLLERIEKEKAQLIKDKKFKLQKTLPPISEAEKPFVLPKGWAWCRLGEISKNIHYGFSASAKKNSSGIKLLRITDIQKNSVNWGNVPTCDCKNSEINTYQLMNNDILIARTGGTIGKSYIVKNIPVASIFASYLIRVIPSAKLDSNYLNFFIQSPCYWLQLKKLAWGAGQPNVSGSKLKGLISSLPPLAEQKAIVAKVEKLLAICDQLESQVKTNQTHAKELMQVVLKEAFTQSDNKPPQTC